MRGALLGRNPPKTRTPSEAAFRGVGGTTMLPRVFPVVQPPKVQSRAGTSARWPCRLEERSRVAGQSWGNVARISLLVSAFDNLLACLKTYKTLRNAGLS
jgi:hypothetical protein